MPVVGLTGGIATGKSTVASAFRAQGAVVLSADDAARAVTAPGGPALPAVVGRFGTAVLHPDGSLDRAALGARVFADSEERRALEEITHPHILRLLHDQIDAALREQPDAVVVVETPLLYEAGMRPWFDMVVVVAASEETQIARLCVCRGMTRDGALARIRAQMPLADKIADADYTLWNDGDAEAIEPRVGEALRMLTARVAERGPRSRRGKKGACTITGRVL